jgi:hypothetical protein
MKIVLWRFVHGCFPTAHQLRHRYIECQDVCVFCHQEEKVEHVFLFCQYAREVWQELKKFYMIQLRRNNFVRVRDWMFDFLERSSEIERIVLAVTIWHIWETRNGIRHGEAMKHPNSLAEKIKAYVEMIEQHLCKPVSVHRRASRISLPHWTPPPEGTVFISVDAALFAPSSRMGVGVVIRNHIGMCLFACSQVFDAVTSPELAEALAVRRALTLAQEEGFNKIILASDCLTVIKRMLSNTLDRTGIGVVIQDINQADRGGFLVCEV